MPRKPHNEGVLLYHLATFLNENGSNLPFSIDWCLADKKSDAGAPSICKKFFSSKRWRRNERVIIVGDAAFGTLSLFNDLHKKGHYPHFALHSSSFKIEKSILSQNLLLNAHREALDSNGFLLSSKYVSNGVTSRVLYVGSCAYEPITVNQSKALTDKPLYSEIIPPFKVEELRKKSIDALKEIAKPYGIDTSGNKPDIIYNIQKYIYNIYSNGDISIINHAIMNNMSSSNKSDIHVLYRNFFNAVDLLDKKYYSRKITHRVSTYESKVFFGLLSFGIQNVHALYSITNPMMLLMPFREKLALKLLNETAEIVKLYYS
ncbi:hypothetical protein WA158_003552 [Blastocystis sp. Blastoise]